MHAGPADRRRAAIVLPPLLLGLAGWNNAVVPRLAPGRYVPVNLTAAGVLLTAARWTGCSWDDLGLATGRVRAGLRHGGPWAAAVAGGYAAALAVPALRPVLRDPRIAGLDGGAVAVHALVRVPLGTVLWEEIAFRGVLPAVLARAVSPGAARAVSAGMFGLWHVRPTLDALAAAGRPAGRRPRASAVLAGCAATSAGGVLLCRLRRRSGSLAAPALLHLAANALGTLAAAAAHRLG